MSTLSAADALAQIEADLGPVKDWTPETRAQINAIRAGLGVAEIPPDNQAAVRRFGQLLTRFAEHVDPTVRVGVQAYTDIDTLFLSLPTQAGFADAGGLAERLSLPEYNNSDSPDSRYRFHAWVGDTTEGVRVELAWTERLPDPADPADQGDLADDFDALGGVAGLRADLGLPADEPVIVDPTHRWSDHRQPDGAWCLWSHVGTEAEPADRRCPVGCPDSSVVAAEARS